jgi:hypothetical protein
VQDASADDEQRIRYAYELLYSRPASDAEVTTGKEYLVKSDEPVAEDSAKLSRWERYAQALLATNEFMHVD